MKIIASAIALLLAAAGAASAEPAAHRERTTSIDVDPLGLLRNHYSFGFAHAFGRHVGMRLEASHDTGSPLFFDDSTSEATATAAVFLDHVLHGPFVAFGLRGRSTGIVTYAFTSAYTAEIHVFREHAVDAVAQVGWQFTFASGLSLTAVATAAKSLESDLGGGDASPRAIETTVRAGYAW